jgi:exopolysaccharide biosynthesis polyprenyl glycosylphosphotransferase
MTIRVVPSSREQHAAEPRFRPWTSNGDSRSQCASASPTPPEHPGLKWVLMLVDASAITLAWTIVLAFLVSRMPWADGVALVATLAMSSVAFAGAQRLYQARACTVRSEEKARLLRVAVFDAAVVLALAGLLDVRVPVSAAAWGSLFSFLTLCAFRSAFRQWLTMSRANGRFLRPIVIAGDNDESEALVTLLLEQPELGFEVLGYVGRTPAEAPMGDTGAVWLGPGSTAVETATRLTSSGLLIVASAHAPRELNELTRAALAAGLHVHLSTGLHGVVHRRLRPFPLSYEPLFYVEPVTPSRVALATKRATDVVLASVTLTLALPVLLVAALAVKLGDRGPVLYHQQRVGRHGKPFPFYKLRTMTPGSDARLGEVWDRNRRLDSPLFKDPQDPRRTRVGRVLEATSIDELPQLWNVLRGDMSLVGPRPALPHEVAQFDEDLLGRHAVRPGITGLWQVEGRDNPHFRPYRRLDLVYVENFSLSLDAVILSMTVQIVLARAAAKLFRRDGSRAEEAAADGAPEPVLVPVPALGGPGDPCDPIGQ